MGQYEVYFGKQLMPVAPETMDVKINGRNSTMSLADGIEINVLKKPGLTEINLELRLPIQKYSWSNYGGATDQVRFLNMFSEYKEKMAVFEFTVLRNRSDYETHKSAIFSTNMKVTIEDYTIKENHEYGGDVLVEMTLKQFQPFYITATVASAVAPRKEVFYTPNTVNAQTAIEIQTLRNDTLASILNRYYTPEAIAGNRAARAIINANTSLQSRGIRITGGTVVGLNTPLSGGMKLSLPIV